MFTEDEFYICDHSRQGEFTFPRSRGIMCLDCGQHLWLVDETGGPRDGLKGWIESDEALAGEDQWWAGTEGFL